MKIKRSIELLDRNIKWVAIKPKEFWGTYEKGVPEKRVVFKGVDKDYTNNIYIMYARYFFIEDANGVQVARYHFEETVFYNAAKRVYMLVLNKFKEDFELMSSKLSEMKPVGVL